MEHKFLEPIELTDAELDVVSGGFVGVKQVNVAKQSDRIEIFIFEISGSTGAVNVTTPIFLNISFAQNQSNSNTGTVTNSGAVARGKHA